MDGRFPANGSRCHGCGQTNHWKSVCRRHEESGRTSHTEVRGRRQQPVERRGSRTKSRHRILQDTRGDYSRRTGDHRRGSVHSVNQTTNNLGEWFETLIFDDVVVSIDTKCVPPSISRWGTNQKSNLHLKSRWIQEHREICYRCGLTDLCIWQI